MDRENIGALAVMEGDTLEGIFSERDVMLRVVLEKRDPEKTRLGDVMTSPVETITRQASSEDALKMMLEKHIRHLPVMNKEGKAVAMLSIRNLLHEQVQDLTDQLGSLEAYFTADGAGG
jgi:CBS domain-containing protein